jgi:ribosome-associated protein
MPKGLGKPLAQTAGQPASRAANQRPKPRAGRGQAKDQPAPTLPLLLKALEDTLADYKAQAVAVIPMTTQSSFTDFLLIATGTSSRHVAAMGQALTEQHRSHLLGAEGLNEGEWVCADFGSVVVHLFTEEKRVLYNLEKLWSFPF